MTSKPEKKKTILQRRAFTAQEKCQAVLSVWSEMRKPREICREMGISWSMLNQWQQRAMGGIIESLEPHRQAGMAKGPCLGPRLEALLERTVRSRSKESKLVRRLQAIQPEKPST